MSRRNKNPFYQSQDESPFLNLLSQDFSPLVGLPPKSKGFKTRKNSTQLDHIREKQCKTPNNQPRFMQRANGHLTPNMRSALKQTGQVYLSGPSRGRVFYPVSSSQGLGKTQKLNEFIKKKLSELSIK
uniref:Uncharacterized protein n=1 Tax=Strombidium inclinatum TaxID=197538 RepID=A0A7S3ID69_9SPIT|mmetsp:Transcript_1062/g.1253  ORF Transcript_1062/g.1253 Transcript_1062/m.1253 type:complete len:128 (+) Transcript_1062:664-1047(+)